MTESGLMKALGITSLTISAILFNADINERNRLRQEYFSNISNNINKTMVNEADHYANNGSSHKYVAENEILRGLLYSGGILTGAYLALGYTKKDEE